MSAQIKLKIVTRNRHAHAIVPIDLFRRTSVQFRIRDGISDPLLIYCLCIFFHPHLNLDEKFSFW